MIHSSFTLPFINSPSTLISTVNFNNHNVLHQNPNYQCRRRRSLLPPCRPPKLTCPPPPRLPLVLPHVPQPDPPSRHRIPRDLTRPPWLRLHRRPSSRNYKYTLAFTTTTIISFLDALFIKKFAVYILDYDSPIAFRPTLERPDVITAVITWNGNAYVEGMGKDFWAPI